MSNVRDNQESKPAVRFKGFSDAWEQRKLSSIVTRVTRKNTGLVSDLPLTISAQDGLVDQVTYFNKRVASKNMEHYLLLLNGEFAYNKSYSKDYPWGAIKRLDMYPRGALSTLYIAFKPTSVNSEFLVAYYETRNWYKQVSERAAEGARNHGLLNIAPHDFFDTRLLIPKTDDEQRNIGLFIKKLDHTIALHQRKVENLQKLKKSLLQQMFVSGNDQVPKIRFKGFSDAWEKRNLGDVLQERNVQQTQSKDCPLVSFTVQDGVTPKTERYDREQLVVGDSNTKKYKLTMLEDIVYNPANLKFGAIARNTLGKAVLSPIYITFAVDNNLANPAYIEMLVTRQNFIRYALRFQQGTVYERQSVSPTALLNIKVFLPSKTEQSKIGAVLSSLDKLIAVNQRKVENLKKLKKSLLRLMFI